MKRTLLNVICIGLIISLFSACSGGNKFASSFGKRKYLKGYYQDVPSSIASVPSNEEKQDKRKATEKSSNFQLELAYSNETLLPNQIIKGTSNCNIQSRYEHPLYKPAYEAVPDTPVTAHKIKYVYINGGWYASEPVVQNGYLSICSAILTAMAYLFCLLFIAILAGAGLAGVAVGPEAAVIAYIALGLVIAAIALAVLALISKNEKNKGLAIAVLVLTIPVFVALFYFHIL